MNNKKAFRVLFIFVFAYCFSGCASLKATTPTPNVDFSKYKTFSWAIYTGQANDPKDALVFDQLVKDSATRQLTSKGLSLAVSGAMPDLVMAYGARSESVYTQPGEYYGGDYYGDQYGYWGATQHATYPIRGGVLWVFLVDAKTHQVVWKGKATCVVGKPSDSKKQIQEAVENLLKKYPNTGST